MFGLAYDNACMIIFRVKLAVNRESLEAVAVKIVDLRKSPLVEKNIRKEVRFISISIKYLISFFGGYFFILYWYLWYL